jgi:ATP-dependent DNA ligase
MLSRSTSSNPASHPPDRRASGPDWIHEIKHDGLRLMVRRDPAGMRLANPQRHRLIDDGREGR